MTKPDGLVYLHYLTPVFLRNRKALHAFIIQLFTDEAIQLEMINYIFCSDDYLHNLNLKYLKHDTYTDIVTFQLSEKNAPVVSDIYISIDRVKENARSLKTTFTQELHRVIFHGALHLCNYVDKTDNEKKLMRAKEDFYLNSYFVSRETI